MNKVIMMGRLTRDPEVRYSQGAEPLAIARYTLAVDRRRKSTGDGDQTADFIQCVSFGKIAEVAEKYYKQGTKLLVTGRIQTGSYTNKEGNKVYTTEVVVEEAEFAESKASSSGNGGDNGYQSAAPAQTPMPTPEQANANGFMNIPDQVEDDLPFK